MPEAYRGALTSSALSVHEWAPPSRGDADARRPRDAPPTSAEVVRHARLAQVPAEHVPLARAVPEDVGLVVEDDVPRDDVAGRRVSAALPEVDDHHAAREWDVSDRRVVADDVAHHAVVR